MEIEPVVVCAVLEVDDLLIASTGLVEFKANSDRVAGADVLVYVDDEAAAMGACGGPEPPRRREARSCVAVIMPIVGGPEGGQGTA